MQEFSHYYEILGLEVGASLEEINEAYRDLAFVWHPDRLPRDNPRLLAKAARKLKEINQARDRLKELLELELSAKTSQIPKKDQTSKAPKAKPKSKPKATSPPPYPPPGDRPPQSHHHHHQTNHNHSSSSQHHHQETTIDPTIGDRKSVV